MASIQTWKKLREAILAAPNSDDIRTQKTEYTKLLEDCIIDVVGQLERVSPSEG